LLHNALAFVLKIKSISFEPSNNSSLMKYLSTLFFYFCLIGFSYAQQKKVLVILVDGIPYDVITKVNTPNLHKITSKGAFAKAYVGGEKGGKTESPTISAVGYNSMLTGTWANKHNVWGNGIEAPNYDYPTFFKLAKEANPNLILGIFSTWLDNRTKLLGEGLTATNNLMIDYKYDGYELDTVAFPHDKNKIYIKNIDKLVTEKAAETIKSKSPDVSWLYLEFTDDMGHKHGDSKTFYQAVEHADLLIGQVCEAVGFREKKFKEDWLVIVTTDHGRDAQTGKNHGGQSDRERITWIAMNKKPTNPRFKNGLAVVDIFPSICKFLNIDIPKSVKENLEGISFF
jgi:predicted AlkP superfamily pyrophosphatase or phosphodiesterase